tara:strand:+ start:175531 stop:176232 length:702 start_codon:yes stop_codon:yes gene_type:complete
MIKRKRSIIDLVLVAIFALLYWKPFVFNVSEAFDISIPLKRNGFGIDVSHHQGEINWDTILHNNNIKPNIDFVFIKASEGLNYIDPQFELNASRLIENNVPTGAYHFFQPKKASVKQAVHFINTLNKHKLTLPPVLDVEVEGNSKDQLLDSVDVWLNHVETKTGRRPIIYCSWSFYKNYFSDHSDYKFWIARYSSSIDFERDKKIIYWQFSEKAQLPFHNSKVDVNVSSIKFN